MTFFNRCGAVQVSRNPPGHRRDALNNSFAHSTAKSAMWVHWLQTQKRSPYHKIYESLYEVEDVIRCVGRCIPGSLHVVYISGHAIIQHYLRRGIYVYYHNGFVCQDSATGESVTFEVGVHFWHHVVISKATPGYGLSDLSGEHLSG